MLGLLICQNVLLWWAGIAFTRGDGSSSFGSSTLLTATTPLALPTLATSGRQPEHGGLVTCTRFWGTSSADLLRLDGFIGRAVTFSDYVLVAVRVERDKTDTLKYIQDMKTSGTREKR